MPRSATVHRVLPQSPRVRGNGRRFPGVVGAIRGRRVLSVHTLTHSRRRRSTGGAHSGVVATPRVRSSSAAGAAPARPRVRPRVSGQFGQASEPSRLPTIRARICRFCRGHSTTSKLPVRILFLLRRCTAQCGRRHPRKLRRAKRQRGKRARATPAKLGVAVCQQCPAGADRACVNFGQGRQTLPCP